MRNLNVQAIYSLPAFAFGCATAAVLLVGMSLVTQLLLLDGASYGVLVPGVLLFVMFGIPLAALVFFPVFFVLRWAKFLNLASLACSIALVTLFLSWPRSVADITPALVGVVVAMLSASVAFYMLRGWARANARSN